MLPRPADPELAADQHGLHRSHATRNRGRGRASRGGVTRESHNASSTVGHLLGLCDSHVNPAPAAGRRRDPRNIAAVIRVIRGNPWLVPWLRSLPRRGTPMTFRFVKAAVSATMSPNLVFKHPASLDRSVRSQRADLCVAQPDVGPKDLVRVLAKRWRSRPHRAGCLGKLHGNAEEADRTGDRMFELLDWGRDPVLRTAPPRSPPCLP